MGYVIFNANESFYFVGVKKVFYVCSFHDFCGLPHIKESIIGNELEPAGTLHGPTLQFSNWGPTKKARLYPACSNRASLLCGMWSLSLWSHEIISEPFILFQGQNQQTKFKLRPRPCAFNLTYVMLK